MGSLWTTSRRVTADAALGSAMLDCGDPTSP